MSRYVRYLLSAAAQQVCLISLLCLLALTTQSLRAQPSVADQVAGTPHNMSVSGPGSVRASDETRVCVFCHTPHGADGEAPLWNRYETTTTFSLYPSGGSMQSTPSQPNGSSRVCLSCHDGMTAIGLVRSELFEIPMYGVTPQGVLTSGGSNLGTSLSDDHPVSFIPSLDDLEIIIPSQGSGVTMDETGQVQCNSCHDPHNNTHGNFLVMENAASSLCRACHGQVDWEISIHGNPLDPQFQQMADQGCASCHVTHGAQSPRLLTYFEEALCLGCHDGVQNAPWEVSGATDMVQEFQKASTHPIGLNPGIHDAGEGPLNSFPIPSLFLPEEDPTALRHAECVDCHNPHSASNVDPPGSINGALANMWGIAENGTKIDVATEEYQLCFKCHGDSENRPGNQANTRLEFSTSNASYHPVIAPGTNSNVPSLLAPWTEQSTMNCSDCHGNNDPQGPAGPHGSQYAPILKSNYDMGYGQLESSFAYAACYNCHDRDLLFNQQISTFKHHGKHVRNEERDSCFMCHSAHGSADYAHLIRFDEDQPFIEPSTSGRLEYIERGSPPQRSGSCYLSCHGENHDPKHY